jgi:hypothetical protein
MKPLVVMSGEPPDRNREMRKLIKQLRRLDFTKPDNYDIINLSHAYNASNPSSRASMAQQLRVNAMRAMMPDMPYGNVVRSSLSRAPANERRLLENPVFGRRSSPSARVTKKRPREPSRSRANQTPELPVKRVRTNNNNIFIGNSNSPSLPEGIPTTGVRAYMLPHPAPPLEKYTYVVATLFAPATGVLGNPAAGNLGFIEDITMPLISEEFVKRYKVSLVADPAHPTSIYEEGQLALAPPSNRPDLAKRVKPPAPAKKYPYYNPYYLTVEGPPGEVQAQGQLLPRGLRPRAREEIEAMPAGDDKMLLDFYYAWPDLIATTTGVYRDFLLNIYKKQSPSNRSPTAFTTLIHESIIPRQPNPAFLYGVHLLLSDPRSFIAHGRHYTEAFIQTLIDNGIYIPHHTHEAARLSIQARIELYLRIILFHQFTQLLNPWVNKIFKIEIQARSGNTHTRRVNTNMAKWSYKIHHIGKLQLADRRVLDAAFAAAKNLALQHV